MLEKVSTPPIARLRGLEHGEIGAEHVRRPVDQEDMVAFA
jgi:hypothetical protein